MKLLDIYSLKEAPELLYELLLQRRPEANISHRSMPTYQAHLDFIASRPYQAWYIIEADGEFVGSVYLSKAREVGLFLFSQHQRKGYGRTVIEELLKLHPGRLLANIAPRNVTSQEFFRDLGFVLIQVTYELSDGTPRASKRKPRQVHGTLDGPLSHKDIEREAFK